MVARTTPSQTFMPTFFFIKRSKIGTIKIYMAVINPAFPTVVKEIPNCWKLLAIQSISPQLIPPMINVFLSPFCCKKAASPSSFFFCLSKNEMTGSSTKPPIKLRTPLKVKHPTAYPPTLCATNATPQIKAVNRRIRLFFICFIFIFSDF